MKKYIITGVEGNKQIATSKAREDISFFLKDLEFSDLKIKIPKSKLKKALFSKSELLTELNKVEEEAILVFQYPLYSHFLEDAFLSKIKNKNKIKKILLLHDVESLRFYKDNRVEIDREINFFNHFDIIISHNTKMSMWLKSVGVMKPLIDLELFDYSEKTENVLSKKEDPIIFAGNLIKSKFLTKLKIDTPLKLYGINPNELEYATNISYEGSYEASKLGEHIIGGFGLVWDGDSIETCTGVTGEYMRFNNPHKISLYLAKGLPIIIWKESALSSFVVENGLGFLVDDLSSIDRILSSMTESDYEKMQTNVLKFSQKIRHGAFIKKAINESLRIILEEQEL